MRKVIFTEFGGPEVLHVVDAESPHPGPGEIRVAVHATGVNPVDWRIRSGQFEQTPTATHKGTALPAGIGQDAAGVVDELGQGVQNVQVGDPVFGRGVDTYAEHAILSSWAPLPEELTFEEAAGYPSVVETALRIIREVGVRPGQTLLVNGASGGVGSATLQIARDRGITVIGIAGPANQDYVHDLGAEATTYGEGWIERVRALGTVDAAVDLAGNGVLPDLVELTGHPYSVITIADLNAATYGVRFSGIGSPIFEALADTTDLISRGKLRLPMDRTYTLEDAASAHADSQTGHARGRRVIVL